MASLQAINDALIRLGNTNFNFYEAITNKHRRRLQAAYVASYVEIDKIIARIFRDFGDELTVAEMFRYNRLIRVQKEMTKIVGSLVPGTSTLITKANADAATIGYYGLGWQSETSFGIDLGFTQIKREALAAAVSNKYDLIGWRDNNKNNIARYLINTRSTITRGIAQGDSYPQMTKALKDTTKKASFKADRVIRTEAHRAFSAGRLVSFEKAAKAAEKFGIEMIEFWISTIDDRTRSCHIDADGEDKEPDGLFHVCGYIGPAPGLFGVAKMDIHCRCTTGSRINDKIPDKRRIQIEDRTTEYVTFKNYLKKKNIINAA